MVKPYLGRGVMKPVMATSCNTKKDNNTEGGKFGEIPDPEGDLFRDPY